LFEEGSSVRTFEWEAFALKVGDRGTKNSLPGQGFIHQQEGCSIRSAAVEGLIERDHSSSDQSFGRSAQYSDAGLHGRWLYLRIRKRDYATLPFGLVKLAS
jgi:hypothetical protein